MPRGLKNDSEVDPWFALNGVRLVTIVIMTPSTVGTLSQETVETLRFLASLYPEGRTLENILEEVKKTYGTTTNIAVANTKAMLMDYRDKKELILEARTGGKSVILLTEKGKGLVWKFVRELWKDNKVLFFTYLKSWSKKKDQVSIELYKRRASSLLLERPEIPSILYFSLSEPMIIQSYARIIEKEADSDLAADINSHLGLLINVGFVKSEDVDQDGKMVSLYYLTKEGRRSMKMMHALAKDRIEGKVESNAPTSIEHGKHPFLKVFFPILISSVVAALIVGGIVDGIDSFGDDAATMAVFSTILPMLVWMVYYAFIFMMKKSSFHIPTRVKK